MRTTFFLLLLSLLIFQNAVSFSTSQRRQSRAFVQMQKRTTKLPASRMTPPPEQPDTPPSTPQEEPEEKAATGTVNQRLLLELEEAAQRERNGRFSSSSATTIFGSAVKTDAERRQAIAEAQNLNGVNPVTALVGSFVAFAGAAAFWTLTQYLADTFAAHPVDSTTTVYVVARLTTVLRNAVVGLTSLGAGFFGVTGVGIFALGVRVGYGVWITKELDPTPRQQNNTTTTTTEVDMGAMWALMTNQNTKRGQR